MVALSMTKRVTFSKVGSVTSFDQELILNLRVSNHVKGWLHYQYFRILTLYG